MPPARQFFPQRGGKNAAATDRGVTSDADFHTFANHGSRRAGRMDTDKNGLMD
jgi:hypothetical protein